MDRQKRMSFGAAMTIRPKVAGRRCNREIEKSIGDLEKGNGSSLSLLLLLLSLEEPSMTWILHIRGSEKRRGGEERESAGRGHVKCREVTVVVRLGSNANPRWRPNASALKTQRILSRNA